MARYEVRCEVEVPDEFGATDKEVEDWVGYNLKDYGRVGPFFRVSPIQNRAFDSLPFTVRVEKIGRSQRLNRERF